MIVRAPVRVDGLTEVKASLRAIPAAISEVVGDYIEQWADDVLAETQNRAPRGETGDLADSYDQNIRDDGLQAAVGTNLHRAKFTELGTRRTRAQPHLYPSFRQGNREFRKKLKDTVQDIGKARTRVRRFRKTVKRG